MNLNKSSIRFCKLPLTIAIGSAILIGCTSTPVNNGAKITTVPATGRPNNSQPNRNTSFPNTVAQSEAVSSVPAGEADYGTSLLDDDSLDELANLLEATDMAMVEDDKLAIERYGNLWDRMRAGFAIDQSPYQFNPRIEAQKSWFTSRQDYINRLTARASRYLYHTVKEAERRNIPTELALLPVIESSYDPTATSNASAAGMWQFIPSTGRIYGLTQTPTYDGRRDVVESTRAAYDFLTSLYNQFGSWELALAAYNAGPGRVQNAIDANRAQGLPTDFWSLNLPKETMNYVPRFMAVAQIIANANQHGVYLPAIANRQHFRSVPVKYGVSLQSVAQITGVNYEELKMLNPALVSARVDIAGPNRIIIPNQVNTLIDSQLSQLTQMGSTTAYQANISDDEYVEMSQSSEGLADFATRARAPQQNNAYIAPSVSSNSRREPAISTAEKNAIDAQFESSNTLPTTSARVTSNATIIQEPPLSAVEKKFIADQIRAQAPNVGDVVSPVDGNVKLEAIQTQQSILEAKGKEKKIRFEGPAIETEEPVTKPINAIPTSTVTGSRTVYTVQRGDTLLNIASRAGVNWRDIADWNQINPNATLLAGTRLYLYGARPIAPNTSASTNPSPNNNNTTGSKAIPNTYVVRPGDTLIGTANRVGLSVSQLARYNNLSTKAELQKGQTLWLIPGMVTSSAKTSSTTATSTGGYGGKTQAYTVKRGESLIGLASRFNVSTATLAQLNDLDMTDELLIGQRLKVPSGSAVESPSNTTQTTNYKGTATKYKVRAGDTLIGIGNKLSVSHTAIADLNNISPSTHLQRGQVIKLPVEEQQVDLALNNKSIKYKVRSGDSLIGLANKFGVSLSNLAAANKLSTKSQLLKGRTITIPSAGSAVSRTDSGASNTRSARSENASATRSQNPETYKVTSGDSLIGLANKFGVSVSQLAAANNMSTRSGVRIGQTLKIPNGDDTSNTGSTNSTTTSSRSAKSSTTSRTNTGNYRVKSGDSLIGLAKQNGLTTAQLAEANNLQRNAQLQIGQTISIPATTTQYRVTSGDSLIRLARKYGITTKELADLNGIASNTELQIGQKLTVPIR